MKRTLLACLLLAAACICAQAKVYPNRWFYVSTGLTSEKDVEEITQLVKTAAEHGLNGMLLSARMDQMDLLPEQYFERLKKIKAVCDQNHIEIIPSLFSVGYGGAILAHDKNLAAGLPATDALFVVKNGQAQFVPDGAPKVANGGFEQSSNGAPANFEQAGKAPDAGAVDTSTAHGGKASLRLDLAKGSTRFIQELAVKPFRQYRLTMWVKTDGIQPLDPFRCNVAGEGRNLNPWEPRLAATGGWQQLSTGFNSLNNNKVRLELGVEDGKAGRIWVDDLKVEEVGLLNALRRGGTPVVVRGEKSGTVYREGQDYEQISDPKLNYRWDHAGPAIRIAGERIKSGERLRVSYFHPTTIYKDQVVICMSEPKVYDIWRTQAKLIQRHLAPKKWFFAMDEVRMGGWCEACKRRHMDMAQILGDTIRRQIEIVRKASPGAEVFIWSDMLDPNHNGRPGIYYLCNGGYNGSWNYVPKDLRIACWYFERRYKSLDHFSKLGFKTIAGAYYDADDLENPKGWLEALDQTPGAIGIMYTTWQHKFKLLAPFGDLVSKGK